MMNLVIDIGNTRMKAAVFRDRKMVGIRITESPSPQAAMDALRELPQADRCILSSTRGDESELKRLLCEKVAHLLEFLPGTPVPLVNRYATPQTLGCDRLAAAVGGASLFPHRNLFIADLGSAITEDVVTAEGSYLGGSISPGLAMRLRALSDYTGCLPRIEWPHEEGYEVETVPASTREAMISGAAGGIELELCGRIRIYSRLYPDLVTIFTGGDAPFFEKRFKNTIFASHELVLTGLNTILDYNADRKYSI